jgi:hypothetical protein
MRLTWAILGTIAVIALWGATACANFVSGLALSTDPDLKWVFGTVSAAADVLKVAAIFAVVSSALAKRWGVMVLGCIIFLLCAAHSARSTFSFVYNEVQAASLARTVEGVASASLVDQLKAEARRLSWTAEQSTASASRRERSLASDEYKASGKNIERLRERVLSVRHRPGDDPLAQALGISDKTAVLASSLFLTLLLEIGSGCGFYMLTRAAKAKPPRVKMPARPVNDDAPEPDLAPIEHQAIRRKISARSPDAPPTSKRVHKKITCMPAPAAEAPDRLPVVVARKTGSTVTARAIKAELERRGVDVTDTALGLALRRQGYKKRSVNGTVVYLNCALAA